MDSAHSHLVGLALGGALFGVAAGAWFAYFRLKERSPRPFGVMLAATLGGYGAALVSSLVYERMESMSWRPDWSVLEAGGTHALFSSLLIGFVEEGTKFLPTLLIVLVARRRFERTQDGIFVAACAGVGFAAAENMLMWQGGLSLMDGLARAAAAPVAHALFAAPWGLGLGLLVRRGRVSGLALGFTVAVMAHGFYDLMLASPVLPHAVAAAEVLCLWVWLIVRTAPKVLAKVPVLRQPAVRATRS